MLKNFEETKAVRIRAPKRIMRRLERMTPVEIGAWIYHLDKLAEEHSPELTLENPPPPIPTTTEDEKPINPRLAELLKNSKPLNWAELGARIQWTSEELEADQAFWAERQAERAQERAALMRELEAEIA